MRLFRFFYIIHIIGRYRLDTFLRTEHTSWKLRFLLCFWPWRYFYSTHKPRAERLRLALQDLGTLYIKLGQLLSTRRDLLADDLADQLALLQDRVPPFSGEKAVTIIESSLKRSITACFAEFDTTPIASASVAQVHFAKLHSGEEVAVKVVRPDIEPVIRRDLSLLYTFAYMMRALSADLRRLRPVEVVKDYQNTILDELDFHREAANTSQLRRNFIKSGDLYIPKVYWDYCSRSVLVLERIDGIPVSDVQQLKALGVNMKKLAERGVHIFFTQVFRDSFFHADMHPGNIFVSRKNPQDPSYLGVDCGIIGSLTQEDQSYLARNLLAFFKQDYRKVARLYIDSGWIAPDTPVNAFEDAIRSICEPIFEKPLKDISFGQVLLRLFQIARRFNMEVQPQLVLLQKTLLNIEGLGRQLYPDLDLWQTARPFLERWMRKRSSPMRLRALVPDTVPMLVQHLPQISQWLERECQHQKQRHIAQTRQAAPKPLPWRRSLGLLVSIGLIGVGYHLNWHNTLPPGVLLLGGLAMGLLVS